MTDLISRQAAIDAIERLILPQTKGETAAEEINRVAWRCAINCAEEMVRHLPPIDPVKNGRWEKIGHIENTWLVSKCSECGYQTIDAGNYCTYCGAKMNTEEGEAHEID